MSVGAVLLAFGTVFVLSAVRLFLTRRRQAHARRVAEVDATLDTFGWLRK